MRLAGDGKEGGPNWGLLAATGVTTFAAALGVSGGTNVWLDFIDHDLVKKHRPTLTFRSALIGDGIILPIINCLMMDSFDRWKPKFGHKSMVLPVAGGTLVSLAFHMLQGRREYVNWTMPKPWRWNALGYYHFVFMSTQFTYMMLYFTQLAGRWPKGDITGEQKVDMGLIAVGLSLFGLLLQTDYE